MTRPYNGVYRISPDSNLCDYFTPGGPGGRCSVNALSAAARKKTAPELSGAAIGGCDHITKPKIMYITKLMTAMAPQ